MLTPILILTPIPMFMFFPHHQLINSDTIYLSRPSLTKPKLKEICSLMKSRFVKISHCTDSVSTSTCTTAEIHGFLYQCFEVNLDLFERTFKLFLCLQSFTDSSLHVHVLCGIINLVMLLSCLKCLLISLSYMLCFPTIWAHLCNALGILLTCVFYYLICSANAFLNVFPGFWSTIISVLFMQICHNST